MAKSWTPISWPRWKRCRFPRISGTGPEKATYHGWEDVVLGEKIDYVFVEPSIAVRDATIVRENPYRHFLSDHYPVVATLDIPGLA